MRLEQVSAQHCFVMPALDGPITGGTLYNRELCQALRELGDEPCVFPLGSPGLSGTLDRAPSAWVDSLYLAQFPELRAAARGHLGLILHYLPSFVALGRAALCAQERRAIDCADALLVTSGFMRGALEELVAPPKTVFVVEPGSRVERLPRPAAERSELRVSVACNVVPGKGIEPWLSALGAALGESDRLQVSIVGSLSADPKYAGRCSRLVRTSRALSARVTFRGALSHAETLATVAGSDLFVSASRMESYGIALAEARALGIPILARSAGNAAAHVDPKAGGQLVSSDAALAQACVTLARDRAQRHERLAKAQACRPPARSWVHAAQEFKAQLADWEK